MSERYSRLFTLQENLYAEGSPVLIVAGALLKDNQTGKVIAQLKMRNISSKAIKAVKICIYPLDTVGNPLGERVEYQYLDLSAIRDEEFGQKVPVALSDASTRSFSTTVEEVIFADNSIWRATGATWDELAVPCSLRNIGDAELVKQFRLKYGVNCKNLPLTYKDLWFCVCGELNRQSEGECYRCQKSFALMDQFDIDELRKEKDTRVAAEREQAEQQEAATKAKVAKFHKITATVLPIITAIIVVAVLFSVSVQKKNAYAEAIFLMEAGEYEAAVSTFEALGNYKDSRELFQKGKQAVEQCVIPYNKAISLLETAEPASVFEAYYILKSIIDYKDSSEILTHYRIVLTEVTSSNGTDDKIYYYNADGNIEKIDKKDWVHTLYMYDKKNVLKRVMHSIGKDISTGEIAYRITTYDKNGYPIKIKDEYSAWEFEYDYSDDGVVNSVTCKYTSIDGSSCDAFINLTETGEKYYHHYSPNSGTLYLKTISNDGRSIQKYGVFQHLGEIVLCETNSEELDEHGNIIAGTEILASFASSGGWAQHYTYENTYDDYGNLIKVVKMNTNSGKQVVYHYSYECIKLD